jgi:hypothetical protein
LPTIVEEMQLAALDQSVSLSDLLRRVKFVAVKLKLGSIEDWVEQELHGYKDTVPQYRIVVGQPMAHSIYHGTQWSAP